MCLECGDDCAPGSGKWQRVWIHDSHDSRFWGSCTVLVHWLPRLLATGVSSVSFSWMVLAV